MNHSFPYRIIIEPLSEADGGGFLATAPDLAGCVSDGATAHEALSNVEDAITQWITEAKELGRAIPAPKMAAA
jgi:antitoxin HicB